MKDLKSTKALVQYILENNPKSRNSDSYLYLLVLEILANEHKIDLSKITISQFLSNLSESVFPPFESVRRSRQKVQKECPWLSACEEVNVLREENEEAFREFARS
jgi:hypothetical protein